MVEHTLTGSYNSCLFFATSRFELHLRYQHPLLIVDYFMTCFIRPAAENRNIGINSFDRNQDMIVVNELSAKQKLILNDFLGVWDPDWCTDIRTVVNGDVGKTHTRRIRTVVNGDVGKTHTRHIGYLLELIQDFNQIFANHLHRRELITVQSKHMPRCKLYI